MSRRERGREGWRDRLPDGERPLDAPCTCSEPRLHRGAPAALAARASHAGLPISTSTRWARASRTCSRSRPRARPLNALGLTGYPKTSGATGVQIYVPVERGWSYDQVRDFVGTLGRTIERRTSTADDGVEDREPHRKVFIDHNMNRTGANISAVYRSAPSPARPRRRRSPGRRSRRASHRRTSGSTTWGRFGELGDLFEPVRTEPQDLAPALEAVGSPPRRRCACNARRPRSSRSRRT